MGRDEASAQTPITAAVVTAYLDTHGFPGAEISSLRRLSDDADQTVKSYGYGKPLRVTFRWQDRERDVVIRTMSTDPFGHDRRADRAAAFVLSFDTFNSIPRHIHSLDVGAFAADGTMVSMAKGEPFLVTDFVEGELYATDLQRIRRDGVLLDLDLQRVRALARYLAELHSEPATPADYVRHVRDVLGSGEGIFGLVDSYPDNDAIATRLRLLALEQKATAWRNRLRPRGERARRIHGDFHPYNILFSASTEPALLDTSRGSRGEPADDLTCLAINYLFFGLDPQTAGFVGPMRELWNELWSSYLGVTRDQELLRCVAPFFAWRILVLVSPLWYSHTPAVARDKLLCFAERLLDGHSFDPLHVDLLL